MKNSSLRLGVPFLFVLGLAAVGCGSTDSDGKAGPVEEGKQEQKFAPPAAKPGFRRFVAPVIDLEAGADVTYCQFVFGGFDRDVDVLEIDGYQSDFGHHVVAYGTKVQAPIGTSRICNTEDNTQIGAFLGGTGGEAGSATNLPEGVAFRLVKGDTLMLNTHFINTGLKAVKGESVLDLRFEDADPNRAIASMFVNINLGFKLAPNSAGTADATCTLPQDMDLVMYTNHLHALGSSIYTEVTSPGGQPRMIHEDKTWTYEMQFNPAFTRWGLNDTFKLRKGDVVHTHCAWNNTGASEIQFPDEMCVGIGFFLSKANTSPTCVNGAWIAR